MAQQQDGKRKKKPDRKFLPTSLRLDEKTRRRIEYLSKRYGGNRTQAIRKAVFRMYKFYRMREEE